MFDKAAELYKEALKAEADCSEALFNQGLALRKAQHLDGALASFMKLKRIMPSSAEVLVHIAEMYVALSVCLFVSLLLFSCSLCA